MKSNYIRVSSQEEFEVGVCERILYQSEVSIAQRGKFTLVLSGGNTPKSIFHRLIEDYIDLIDWNHTHLFWLDERCVSPKHTDSNYRLANDHLITKLTNVGSIHRMKGEIDPDLAAIQYKKEIFDFFGKIDPVFDFILLGMGDDGHIASIFPNPDNVLLNKPVFATNEPKNGCRRISLNLSLINSSLEKLLLINSDQKLKVFESGNKSYPVSHVINPTPIVFSNEE
ncbi:MAG: 6-phosphogluconolactonase [Reichenbachiella sp.]